MKMVFNIPDNYSNQTPAPQLDKKTLNKMVWRSVYLQASFNYERMQAGGWLYRLGKNPHGQKGSFSLNGAQLRIFQYTPISG